MAGVQPITVADLRGLFRNYQAFQALFETEGIDEITSDQGVSWSLWDVKYLYDEGLKFLPPRQRQAILLCFVANKRECDAATLMGVSPTNPVSMYANDGLANLIVLIEEGFLPRFRSLQEAC